MRLTHDDYTVAWICALPLEMTAAKAMLDTLHPLLPQAENDYNSYTLGSITGHNIVVACLPSGVYGTIAASTVISQLCSTFPRIQFGLMVGIGGGVPSTGTDIRLGDVVVSKPTPTSCGVIQYDYGKSMHNGRFQRTGSLNKPPRVLLTAISQMQSDDIMGNRPVHGIVSSTLLKNQAMQEQFSRPQEDLLFNAQYNHQTGAIDCSNCDRGKIIARNPRPMDDPYIHYGLIASGDKVMKDATTRDIIAQESGIGVLCFEMEAAGLMDQLPSLVIRGICDYCDSHKNKSWQGYAAIVAAAYAKVLLSVVPVHHHNLEVRKIKGKAWMVPFRKNLRFIGRESEIAELERWIEKSQGPSRIAICGLGGVGKTQIALELAYRLQNRHSDYSVFWIPCTSHEIVEQAYMTLAQILGIHNAKPAEAKNSVKAYLSQRTGRWLLIFDNADDIDMWIQSCTSNPNPVLVDFLPQSDQGRILFTTRNRKLAVKLASSNVVDISEPNIETATKILDNLLIKKDLLDDTGLSSSGNSQAAAYINENDIGFTEYVTLLQEPEPEVIELLSEDFGDGEKEKYANPVATTWLISFQQIQSLNQLAADYLSFMACISPRDIPQSLLPSAISKRKKIEAIGLLKAFSFINEQAEGCLSLHRLVYYATRNWMRNNRQLDPYIKKTADQLSHVFPTEDHTNRTLWRQYLPHAVALISQSEFWKQQKIYATLLERIGMCLYRDGRYGEAEDPALRAMDINVQILGRENTSTLDSMARLAWIYMKQGRRKDAEELQVHVLAASRRVLGPKNPDTLASMSDLACTYHEQGRQEESEELQIQALTALKETLGPEHADTLTSMNNLASVYRQQMRWKEAEELELQVIKLRKRVLGSDHPDTVTAMNNMALIYDAQERWSEAEELGARVVEARKIILGEKHPDTLASMGILALVYRDQRRWKESEDLLLTLIKIRKQVFGPEHLDTLHSLAWLASTYYDQRRWRDAEEIYFNLVETCKRVLGPQRPETVSNMVWLAHIYWHQRRWKDAEELKFHILETRKCVLGPEHPDTLAAMHDLAHTWKSRQKVRDALALMEECVALRNSVLGPDHPDALRSSHSLSEFKKADHLLDTNQPTSAQAGIDQSMREISTAIVITATETKHINRAKGLLDIQALADAQFMPVLKCSMKWLWIAGLSSFPDPQTSGKSQGTLIQNVLTNTPPTFAFNKSYTTRSPRKVQEVGLKVLLIRLDRESSAKTYNASGPHLNPSNSSIDHADILLPLSQHDVHMQTHLRFTKPQGLNYGYDDPDEIPSSLPSSNESFAPAKTGEQCTMKLSGSMANAQHRRGDKAVAYVIQPQLHAWLYRHKAPRS
ncbi:kinesin [Aspergillus bombycis]|uniref:Kinesin n=1 Tax=Aspergillus bombycis TaxID=109264 RepID=A0A1F7ZT55_9EURO|nr:kinesin [Aspergillus bombycis]OGM42265.1 kinesin [Aspergillus bombycis]